MGYRNLFISSPARLRVKNAQLVIETEGVHQVPLEDINAIMLEHQAITLNTYLLDALGEAGICTFVCNRQHLPSALVLPFATHYKQPKRLQLQLQAKKPIREPLKTQHGELPILFALKIFPVMCQAIED